VKLGAGSGSAAADQLADRHSSQSVTAAAKTTTKRLQTENFMALVSFSRF
jgi:hypothetical protein